MLYCEKCRSVCPDTTPKCPGCKSTKLRPAEGSDMVRLHRADQYTAELLCRRLGELGIPCTAEPVNQNQSSYLYDAEAMPTDKLISVSFDRLDEAMEVSSQVREEIEKEQTPEGEIFEEMPLKKRLIVQIVSVIAFLVLVCLTVFGADALAGWLKGLLGM